MELIRGGMKAPIVGDWVTAANVGGGDGVATVTDTVTSAVMSLVFPSNFWEIAVGFTFTLASFAGDGRAIGYFRLESNPFHAPRTSVGSGVAIYTEEQGVALTAGYPQKNILWRPLIVQGPGYSMHQLDLARYRVYFTGRGSHANSVWEISDIKCRLIYIPL